jgi:hypothetical protein
VAELDARKFKKLSSRFNSPKVDEEHHRVISNPSKPHPLEIIYQLLSCTSDLSEAMVFCMEEILKLKGDIKIHGHDSTEVLA